MSTLRFTQIVNQWTQTAALAIAGIWVVGYEFLYKDLYVPSVSPMHITPGISITVGAVRDARVPLQVEMTLENTSERDIYILPGVFSALGHQIGEQVSNTDDFMDFAQALTLGDQEQYGDRFGADHSDLVAVGSVFGEVTLGPRESVERTWLIWVPYGKYDEVAVGYEVWAYNGKDDLWSTTKFLDEGGYRLAPCKILRNKGGEIISCQDLMPYSESWQESIQEKHELWSYDAMESVAMPIEGKVHAAVSVDGSENSDKVSTTNPNKL